MLLRWHEVADGTDSMIEFSRMYCGQPVRAEEARAGTRVACPGCGHSLPVVPKKTRDNLRSSAGASRDAAGAPEK